MQANTPHYHYFTRIRIAPNKSIHNYFVGASHIRRVAGINIYKLYLTMADIDENRNEVNVWTESRIDSNDGLHRDSRIELELLLTQVK